MGGIWLMKRRGIVAHFSDAGGIYQAVWAVSYRQLDGFDDGFSDLLALYRFRN